MKVGKVVVDTNVPIVANGRDTHADDQCQLNCIEKIRAIQATGIVVLDDRELILKEYSSHFSFEGEPGVGDAFYKYISDHLYSEFRVLRVAVTPTNDNRRGFEELPENGLDPSDRKFLAVAMVANAPVVNATDSDWYEQRSLLDGLSVTVEQLCPHHAVR